MKPKSATKKTKRRVSLRVNRKEISVATFADMAAQDMAFWKGQSVNARLRAMELLRQINYGKAASGRMKRVFEVVQSEVR
jgi:hypothetical protein